uniref:Uncharacterized protein n=1 Tax=Arundo donax TaxID=35708 RepID=A0A0A9CP74_ARUDO
MRRKLTHACTDQYVRWFFLISCMSDLSQNYVGVFFMSYLHDYLIIFHGYVNVNTTFIISHLCLCTLIQQTNLAILFPVS